MDTNLLTNSLQNMSLGVILQVVIRIVTFLSNAYVLRYIDQEALGVMNVRLLLLESTILFISREAFRKATLDRVKEHNWPLVINLIWLTVPVTTVFSLLCGCVWLCLLEEPPYHLQSQYSVGVWIMITSCIIEMLAEPPVLVGNAFQFIKLKMVLNLLHLATRTLTFLSLLFYSPESSIHAFSAAQLLATVVFVLGYYIFFYYYFKTHDLQPNFPFHSARDFLPSFTQDEWLPWPLVYLTWSLIKTMFVKQILTEGERYIMTIGGVLSLTQQGVYDTINSLGTLPARLLLRPIEENFYFYVAQLFSRGRLVVELDQALMKEASQVLHLSLRCISIFGLTVLVFGWSYSRLLLHLYGGESLSEPPGPTLLRAHCGAVIFLAVNGLTEGFSQAVMDDNHLVGYNMAMVLLSVAFLVLSWGFTTVLGGLGFIVANCCNMSLRILYSLRFMCKQYKGSKWQPLWGLIPGPALSLALLISFVITAISEVLFYDSMKCFHIAVGGICFIGTALVFHIEESELSSNIMEFLSNIFSKSNRQVHDHVD